MAGVTDYLPTEHLYQFTNGSPTKGLDINTSSICHESHTPQGGGLPPIAIVGMAMRLPGGVRTADDFWELLTSKRDCSSEVPQSRYNIDAFYDPNKPQSVRTRRGYFLDDDYLDKADWSFFDQIPGSNMGDIDPQQMSLLEVVWECMENAGQSGWRGRNIGCYVGVFGEDWHELTAKETQAVSRVHAFANGGFALSNRVSYEFDLRGPSATILTACSSSLTAVHEACQAIYNGSCPSAIVAGTNLLLTPSMSVTMSENMVLSPDGYCKTFDASADGYSRGEAVNAIYLKPMDQAIADGDHIRAVIRATSANYDGRTAKIFAPDRKSQELLIRQAYDRAQIHDISQTAFVECHGTGTKAGDLAECTAIAQVFGKRGVHIGSVKSNVGHGEGASGLTAVIKAVLALEHRVIPPNLHFSRPNSNIPFKSGGLQVPVEPTPWPLDRMERVSVNCFGIGGSNAHAILDSAKSALGDQNNICNGRLGPHLFPLSARSQTTLESRLRDIEEYVSTRPELGQDIAYTLGVRRDHLSHRGYMIWDGQNFISEARSTAVFSTLPPSLIFVLTGQGAQWPGMGKELMATFPTFHRDILAMDRILQELERPPLWSIEEELKKLRGSSYVDMTEYSQTLCAAVQIALVNLFASWGIHPAALVGYSSGEVVAAYAAKAIPMHSAIIIAYLRGQCAKSTSRGGGMVVVGQGKDFVSRYLVEGVAIACENSPQSVNISGDQTKLATVVDRILEEKPDTFIRRLPIEVAYHSPDMQLVGSSFEASIAPYVAHNSTMIPMYSTVTGTMISDVDQLDAAYWRQNLESPVLFSSAIQALLDQQKDRTNLFMEVGTHSTLSGPLRQIFSHRSGLSSYIPTLTKNKGQALCLLQAVGEIYSHHCSVDLAAIVGTGNLLTDLPAYPWDRESVDWQESRLSRNWRFRKHPHHELLGSRTLEASDLEPSWRNLLSLSKVPWLNDHRVVDEVVFPCAGYIAMINEAMRQLFNTQECTIHNLHIKVPLILPIAEGSTVETLTTMRPVRINDRLDSKWYEFSISSYDGREWTKHTAGQATAGAEKLATAPPVLHDLPRAVSSGFWYNKLEKLGLEYGPHFQGLEEITADPASFTANATIHEDCEGSKDGFAIQPTVIDQCLQLFSVAACKGMSVHLTKLFIPMFIDEICLGQNRPSMKAQAIGKSYSGSHGQGDVTLIADSKIVLLMRGVSLVKLDRRNETESSRIPLRSYAEWRSDIDLVPGRLQLPESERREDEVGLLARVSVLSIILQHRATCDVLSCSQSLKAYKSTLRAYIQEIKNEGLSSVSEARDWIQQDSEKLQQQWNALDKRLNAKHLGFISKLGRRIIDCTNHAFEGSFNLSALARSTELQKLHDWIASLSNLSEWFSLLCHSNPALRVLEIGGETGSFTSSILQYLTSDEVCFYSHYTWTETPHIDASVEDRLKKYKQMQFKPFNVNYDPLEQDIQEGGLDLIIASNLGSRTPCLGTALKNIRKLLAPGGRLLLHEYCPGIPLVNNLLSPFGRSCFDYGEVSIKGKYMSIESWDKELRQAGFQGVEANMYDGNPPYNFYVNIISRNSSKDSLKDSPIYLLCPSQTYSQSWIHDVEENLIQNGHTVKRCTKGEAIPQKQRVISLLDLDGPFFKSISEEDWKSFQLLINCSPQLLWVTRSVELTCADPDFALVMGVSRTVRQEQELQFGTFQVDIFDTEATKALLQVCTKFFNREEQNGLVDADYEFALHSGSIYIPRMQWTSLTDTLLRTPDPEASLKLDIGSYGSLESLFWSEDEPTSLGRNDVEVEVKFVGLNFRDVMVALGIMGNKDELGMEATGIVRKCGPGVQQFQPGDRVVISGPGVFRTHAVVSQDKCVLLPPSISLEDAASVLVVYVTALYCLMDIGRLENGQSVLIHAACGGVGLAAVQLCQMVGAKIYATVGSEQKAQHLIDNFGLARHQIFNSRDTSFLPKLMQETHGEGADIVLNSLAGELLQASWKCVAEFGKMIEIGKRDFMEHGTIGLEPFGGNRAFFGVDLIRLGEKPGLMSRLARQVLQLYEEGKISPIRPLAVVSGTDTPEAFRSLQQGLHLGKLVVKMPGTSRKGLMARSRYQVSLRPDASYILVGGLGGIGRIIASWMVERGARNLIFLSRSAGQTSQDQSFVRELEVQGCTAIMMRGDVTIMDDVRAAIRACPFPVAGVLQLSMVVRDQFVPDMSHTNWQDTLSAKVTGTWNLHHALTECSANLEFFVVCGSITGVMGNAGQVNYSAANAFVSSFAQYRRQKGLPASVVNLGAVDDVGFLAAQDIKLRERMRSGSVRLLSEQEVLDAFEVAISHSNPIQDSKPPRSLHVPGNLIVGMSSTKSLTDPSVRPLWGQDARFRFYEKLDFQQGPSDDQLESIARLRNLLAIIDKDPGVLYDPSHKQLVVSETVKAIREYSAFARGQTYHQVATMSIDSLMTVEIRNWTRRFLRLDLSLVAITKAATVEGLGVLLFETMCSKYLKK